MINEYESVDGMRSSRGKLSYTEKTSSTILSTINSTLPDLGLNQSRRGGKLTINGMLP
jgi:hypothetical protein